MNLTGNKLSPNEGMHLKYKINGMVFPGEIYIPSTLSENNFEEITADEYNQLLNKQELLTEDNSVTKQEYQELSNRLATVEATSIDNSTQITQVQEALCDIYEQIEE